MLAGAAFRQAHDVFNFEVMRKFIRFIGRQRGRLLHLDQISDALPGSIRRLEFSHTRWGTTTGNEVDDFFVGSGHWNQSYTFLREVS